MTDGIEAIGRRDTDDVRVSASEEEVDDARDKVLDARLRDSRHPLSNAEYQAIQRERIEIRHRCETRAYAATKRGGGGGGASQPSQVGVGQLGLSALMALHSGVLHTASATPRDPASMSRAQLADEIANLKAGIAAFKPPLVPPKAEVERLATLQKELARRSADAPPPAPAAPPKGPSIVPLDRMRSSAEIDAAVQREQAFLAGPLAQLVSIDERKTHEKYLADLEGAARVVRTSANAAKPDTLDTIMAEIDRLRGVLAKPHDTIVDAPVRARIAELERQWVATAKMSGLAPAPRGIDPETASADALKTEMTWLAGGGTVPMHVQLTQGADAYRQRLQEEALLRKPGGLEILLRIHAGDPAAQKRLVTHALRCVGGDAASRRGDSVPSLLARYYDIVAAQARGGNAAVRAMPTMGHDGLVFANAQDAERYEIAQRIVAMNSGTTLGSIAAAWRAVNGGTLEEIRAAGQAGNMLEGTGGGVGVLLQAGRGAQRDTTQKPQVGLVQPNASRPGIAQRVGGNAAAPPRVVGANGTGARVAPPPPPRDGGIHVAPMAPPARGVDGVGAVTAASPSTPPLRTTPMNPNFAGEHVPGNRVWFGQVVTYLSPAERARYKLEIKDGVIYDAQGNRFDTASASSIQGGRSKAIFVVDDDGNVYASTFQGAGRFHHSSFMAGAPVAAAGEIVVDNGRLIMINNASGHYVPDPAHTDQVLGVMRRNGVNVDLVERQDLRPPRGPK